MVLGLNKGVEVAGRDFCLHWEWGMWFLKTVNCRIHASIFLGVQPFLSFPGKSLDYVFKNTSQHPEPSGPVVPQSMMSIGCSPIEKM